MIKYKKLTDYNIYKSIYDTVYLDGKSESSWGILSGAIKRKDFRLYCLLENDIAIGTCGFSNILVGVTIYELMVRKDYQNRGYGTKILNYTLSQVKRLSDPPQLVMAFTNAEHFFEKNEFEIIDHDEDLVDKYIMMITL